MTQPVHVGLIGCGEIAPRYVKNARGFESMRIVACADIRAERARAFAAEHGVPRACGVLELIHDPEVEVVLNLTPPSSHGEIALASVHAGKSVYNEKPLTVRRRDARRILADAERHGLLVGCAPDTFMGAGQQACRRVIDGGELGEIVGGAAFMMNRGPESWHPNPVFFYETGAGPLFDMGPYYITALVNLLGPVARVTASGRTTWLKRPVTVAGREGEVIQVEVPTHVAGVLEFRQGAVVTLVMSFDVRHHAMPHIELYGSEATLRAPDPNEFGGAARVLGREEREWHEVSGPPTARVDDARGIGLEEMCRCLRGGGAHRASGALAYHVLDVMHGIADAAERGRHVTIESSVERPEPM